MAETLERSSNNIFKLVEKDKFTQNNTKEL